MLRHDLGELERDTHAIVRVNVAPMLTSEKHQKRNIVLQLLTIHYARKYLTQSLGLLTKTVDTPPCAKKL